MESVICHFRRRLNRLRTVQCDFYEQPSLQLLNLSICPMWRHASNVVNCGSWMFITASLVIFFPYSSLFYFFASEEHESPFCSSNSLQTLVNFCSLHELNIILTGDPILIDGFCHISGIHYHHCWFESHVKHCRWLDDNRHPASTSKLPVQIDPSRYEMSHWLTEWWNVLHSPDSNEFSKYSDTVPNLCHVQFHIIYLCSSNHFTDEIHSVRWGASDNVWRQFACSVQYANCQLRNVIYETQIFGCAAVQSIPLRRRHSWPVSYPKQAKKYKFSTNEVFAFFFLLLPHPLIPIIVNILLLQCMNHATTQNNSIFLRWTCPGYLKRLYVWCQRPLILWATQKWSIRMRNDPSNKRMQINGSNACLNRQ